MPDPQIYVERTLAIIKPDIINKETEIEDIILRSGFTIVQVTWKRKKFYILNCNLKYKSGKSYTLRVLAAA